MKDITFEQLLAKIGKTESDIEKIYLGGDNCCRCGCQGTYAYFDQNARSFKRRLNALKKFEYYEEDNGEIKFERGCAVLKNPEVSVNPVYINIPHAPDTSAYGRCYTIYFKDEN